MPIKRQIYRGQKKRSPPSEFSIPTIPPDQAAALFQNLGIGLQPGPSQPAAPTENNQPDDDLQAPDNDEFYQQLDFLPADGRLADTPLNSSPDTLTETLIRALRARKYAQKQLDLEKQWASIEAVLTAVFLERQHHTQNWTTQDTYLYDEPPCYGRSRTSRKVDLVNISGRH
ncbi:hypothetical protein CROQUDRAFT_87949 [Cronartium quercuum f. sp. fusiforme G11]|uniref:Uncharacterized protein n=1 Tax=Cronartium quercuum f. sp. fusiforme G11 TaxID=708437 RepID=A0A9P6NNK5_9BASI|nr:hypothetical protein CROQUDRAFT_87949 [Cronartium quercuum f. sp. fusiforme G11]